jgi:16S rRNA (guanine966-N2)-methyltransferase
MGRQYVEVVRVIAGELGGRRLAAPPGTATRPTSDRVREATFGALTSLGVLDGAVVLDGFAGSGALGIEALSRGAATCTFVERDRAALATLRTNLRSLGLGPDRATVVPGDVAAVTGRWDLALLDPPYAFAGWGHLLGRLHAAVAVCESGTPIAPPAGWAVVRQKAYGATVVTILRHDPSPTGHEPNEEGPG